MVPVYLSKMLPIQLKCKTKNTSGFTIIELVVTILIVGILSISVGPRFFGTISYQNRKATDDLLSALRYSQQVAMNRGGDIELILTPTNFTVQRSGGGSLRSPDGLIPYTKTFPATITAVATSTIRFNSIGQPVNSTSIPLTNNVVLNIGSSTITVEADTGYAR